MLSKIVAFILSCLTINVVYAEQKNALPKGFVYLSTVDSSIVQDMRYATEHNFTGRPVPGYENATCILTSQAAEQLKKVQHSLQPLGYSLKIYDCYRPTQAVAAFYAWSQNNSETTKGEFYPQLEKKNLYKLGYVAFEKSTHSRGSTVDLTMVKLPLQPQEIYQPHKNLRACYLPYGQRFHDNSIDMGTGYDCFSELSHPDNINVSWQEYLNRLFLRYWMEKYGFASMETEWWHFTLKNEPFPETYFNFPVAT